MNLLLSVPQLSGAAVLGIGIWTKIDPGQFDSFLGDTGYSISAYILIGAGAVVMFVGFFGCCGAIKESRVLLGLVCMQCFTFFNVLSQFNRLSHPTIYMLTVR